MSIAGKRFASPYTRPSTLDDADVVRLDKVFLLGVRCRVSRRMFLGTGLFLAGALIGFEIAWTIGTTRRERSEPGAPPISSGEVTITLSATVDGSDRFIFTRDNIWNEHGHWQPPTGVLFNGESWDDLSQPPSGWPKVASDLDLRRAAIVTREGRDAISLEPTAGGFEVCFADTPTGAARYTVTISIPRK